MIEYSGGSKRTRLRWPFYLWPFHGAPWSKHRWTMKSDFTKWCRKCDRTWTRVGKGKWRK